MGDWAVEGREPTPEEWVTWFLALDRPVQEMVAARLIANAKSATRCVVEQHERKATGWDRVVAVVRGR